MTFLMLLPVILLSMVTVLSSTLNISRHLMFQQLELASELESELPDTGTGTGSVLFISVLEKLR